MTPQKWPSTQAIFPPAIGWVEKPNWVLGSLGDGYIALKDTVRWIVLTD
jgi:hypothetical protein